MWHNAELHIQKNASWHSTVEFFSMKKWHEKSITICTKNNDGSEKRTKNVDNKNIDSLSKKNEEQKQQNFAKKIEKKWFDVDQKRETWSTKK